MWLRLRRTKVTAPNPVTSPTFSSSSFKDIESLFAEENNNDDNHDNDCYNKSPKSDIGKIFHRVRLAKSLVLAFSNPQKTEQNVQAGSGLGNVNVNGAVPNEENVQESVKPLHHADKVGVVGLGQAGSGVGNDNVDGAVPNEDNVQEQADSGVGNVNVNGAVSNEDNVEELMQTSKSLPSCDKEDGVVGLGQADSGVGSDNGAVPKEEENVQELMQTSKSLPDDEAVPVQDNVQESIETLKSLHSCDKGDGVVVLQHPASVDEPTAIGDVGGVDVPIELPGTETRVVIFFSSLRAIRSTFLDGKYVRTILHSFPVAIDERDLFMDGRFMEELQRIMGKDEKTKLTLPRVFIGGRYIGGAEEIRELHEAGELKKYMEGMAPAAAGTCEVCGGHGFILCLECNGSHKCYVDKGGFKTCTGCNENGLVRCPSCSSPPL